MTVLSRDDSWPDTGLSALQTLPCLKIEKLTLMEWWPRAKHFTVSLCHYGPILRVWNLTPGEAKPPVPSQGQERPSQDPDSPPSCPVPGPLPWPLGSSLQPH